MSMQPYLIVTHVAPDLDAALGTWLFRRYLAPSDDIEWVFVPAGETDPAAYAVIDTGREYEPRRHRYDHHMPEFAMQRSICAASLVYEHALIRATPAQHAELVALRPLVEVVTAGDHGRAPAWSYQVGPHAQASAIRARLRGDDQAMLLSLHQLIDDIASSLVTRARVAQEFATHAYSVSEEVVLIRNSSSLLTRYALDEMGYALALFVSDNRQQLPATVTVGIQRATESALHCGAIVDAVQSLAAEAGDGEVVAEVQRWYRHPSGFFAGRGTAKAPDPSPISERSFSALP